MLRLDNRRKSKEESWKEMLNLSHLGHAGHRSAVIVVFSAIIDASVLVDNLYRRIIKYSGGCCCCWLSRQRIRRIRRIRRRSVVGAVRWSITLIGSFPETSTTNRGVPDCQNQEEPPVWASSCKRQRRHRSHS